MAEAVAVGLEAAVAVARGGWMARVMIFAGGGRAGWSAGGAVVDGFVVIGVAGVGVGIVILGMLMTAPGIFGGVCGFLGFAEASPFESQLAFLGPERLFLLFEDDALVEEVVALSF